MSTKLTINEINKHLERKDLTEGMRKSLEFKKDVISKEKIVKK